MAAIKKYIKMTTTEIICHIFSTKFSETEIMIKCIYKFYMYTAN